MPARAQIRQINQQMVTRILADDASPLVEGSYALRVLHTRGRNSGEPRSTPVGVTLVAGRRYLVSPDTSRDWVRNLTAHPDCELLAGSGSQQEEERFRAVPDDGATAAEVVATYLSAMQVPWAIQAFPVSPGASRDEIAAHLDDIAVFRLDPDLTGPGSDGA
ncbi:MAG: nitroreductase/quinone reductase family protein [Streptosporangiales bacterium]